MNYNSARKIRPGLSLFITSVCVSLIVSFIPSGELLAQKIYLVDASKTQNAVAYSLSFVRSSSWDSACGNLQTAIDSALASDQIWVKSGTYFPTKDRSGNEPAMENQSDRSFTLKNGVRLYGGFGGTELSYNGRNLALYTTILSGKFLQGNPAYSVVSMVNLDASATIDGFRITGGAANNGNNGGGIYCQSSSANIVNCVIVENSSAGRAGGLYNLNASPLLLNCVFVANTASFGAAVYNNNSSPRIINSTVTLNKSTGPGGGIFNESPSAPTVANSIIWGNSSNTNTKDNIYFSSGTASGTVNYSIIGQALGNYPGTNNFNNSPLFANASQGNFRCLPGSPAIDAGNTSSYLSNFSFTDVAGTSRLSTIVDMGAYEGAGTPVVNASKIVYVDSANINPSGNGSSWGEAFTSLADAIQFINYSPGAFANGIKEVWVAKGTYQPSYNLSGKPVPTDPRVLTFNVKDSIKLYGGFSGTENNIGQRNMIANKTTLNGYINVSPGFNGNAYNVISIISSLKVPTIDGFTITGGVANNFIHGGGGIYAERSTYIVTNCRIIKNDHSGIYNYYSNLTLKSCYFSENTADNGGGLMNLVGNTEISDCVFFNNGDDRSYGTGGAIYNSSTTNTGTISSIRITNTSFLNNHVSYSCAAIQNGGKMYVANCVFNGNYTTAYGSGIFGSGGEFPVTLVNTSFSQNHSFGNMLGNSGLLYLINSVITNNVAYRSAGLQSLNQYSTDRTVVSNSIIWGNRSEEPGNWGNNLYNGSNISATTNFIINNSIIGNYTLPGRPVLVFPGIKNLDSDPKFVDTSKNLLMLQPGSPGIDAGDNLSYLETILTDTDLAGATRLTGRNIDIGAYEMPNVVLPLVLLDFFGNKNDVHNKLEWHTADEKNVKWFVLQRSADGNRFDSIQTTRARGSIANAYFLNDNNPGRSFFYRLKIVDNDGSFTYSKLIFIGRTGPGGFDIQSFSNPFKSSLSYIVTGDTNKVYEVRLVDLQGNIRFVQHEVAGNKIMQINATELLPGTYLLECADKLTGKKIVKKVVRN